MRPVLISMLVLHLLLTMTTAHAQSADKAPAKGKALVPKIDCAVATATPELNHCAEIRLKKADSDLAAALEKSQAKIDKQVGSDPATRTKWKTGLDEAYKAWTLYREADCKGLVPFEWQGGTGATLAVLECMAQMTEQRAFELTERYSQER